MCGIVGYVGNKPARSILIEGLKRLEYRGYDSAGVAVVHDGAVHVCKRPGRIKALVEAAAADRDYLEALEAMPEKIRWVLAQSDRIRQTAQAYAGCDNWLFLGRGYQYPVALEGALKLKEISYIHAEGLPAAEMKHGPLALIDENMPAVFIAPRCGTYDKIIGNIEEVRARGGRVIAVATEGDTEIARHAEHVFYVPDCPEPLQPILTVVPLQLLAYHAAVARGCNVDKPRNLAKSVTVE